MVYTSNDYKERKEEWYKDVHSKKGFDGRGDEFEVEYACEKGGYK
jgi:hypothetical protein